MPVPLSQFFLSCFCLSPSQYLQPNGNNWRWFDDRSGRWCSYSASNNSTIDSAWRAGESSVRFTAGRRRYTVQFNTMVQVCRSRIVCLRCILFNFRVARDALNTVFRRSTKRLVTEGQ